MDAPDDWKAGVEDWNAHQRSTISVAERMRSLRVMLAREDPNEFCKFVLRDERSGKKIAQAPLHEQWHKLMSEHDRLAIWSHVEAGKTSQVAIGRVLWELGKDPGLRVAVVSNTNDLAKKMTRQLGQYIEKSRELREVFPALMPTKDPSLPWRAVALTIERPGGAGVGAKDPNVQSCGVHGNIIGSRIDLLVLDDILDFENTHTPGPRDDVFRWVQNIFGRLTSSSRVWCVGNAWHPDDAMHRLEKELRFHGVRFPVMDHLGKVTWPERWDKARIEQSRVDLGPHEYSRQLLCQARDDSSARFKREWVELAIKLGEGCSVVHSAEQIYDPAHDELPEGVESWEELARAQETIWRLTGRASFFTGVDLAVQRHDSADLTALVTIHVDCDGKRRVCEVRSGKWSGPEIIDQIQDVHDKFGSIVIVENNAAQDYIVQFAQQKTNVPVVPFTTGRNKAHPEFGIESIAVEMSGGKWVIPSKGGVQDKEISEWVREMLYYDPKEHTGDRLMAAWFAREGARRFADNVYRPTTKIGVRTF